MSRTSQLESSEDTVTVDQFVKLIHNRRRKLGLSQSDLAGLSGLSIEGLSKIERGAAEPRLSTVLQLLKILGGTLRVQWKQ